MCIKVNSNQKRTLSDEYLKTGIAKALNTKKTAHPLVLVPVKKLSDSATAIG